METSAVTTESSDSLRWLNQYIAQQCHPEVGTPLGITSSLLIAMNETEENSVHFFQKAAIIWLPNKGEEAKESGTTASPEEFDSLEEQHRQTKSEGDCNRR